MKIEVHLTTGEKLQDLRKEKKLSLDKLHKEVEISASTLSYYENDKKNPSAAQLAKLADYYGVSLDWLCGRQKERTPDINIQATCNKYGLDEKTLQKLEAWADYDPPYYINQKRLATLNALCAYENGHSVLDYIGMFLFDEVEEAPLPVKNCFNLNAKITVKKRVFSKVFLNSANDYLEDLKNDLHTKEGE